MTENAKILSFQFKDNLGEDFKIDIEDPKEGLTQEEIHRFMNFIVDSNIIMPNCDQGDSYLVIACGVVYN